MMNAEFLILLFIILKLLLTILIYIVSLHLKELNLVFQISRFQLNFSYARALSFDMFHKCFLYWLFLLLIWVYISIYYFMHSFFPSSEHYKLMYVFGLLLRVLFVFVIQIEYDCNHLYLQLFCIVYYRLHVSCRILKKNLLYFIFKRIYFWFIISIF